MKELSIVVSSEDSLQVQFSQKICEEVNAEIVTFVENLKSCIEKGDACEKEAIIEVLPAYCSVTVYFDSVKTNHSAVKKLIEAAIEKSDRNSAPSDRAGRIIEIPVCYEDEEFAPDLADVAKYTGLSKEEVIKLHHSKDYLIYMLGFLPGFPYLGGMDQVLETPRLETPRTKIPAGSVAIGGKQAGLYPSDSPGGWRIIGRTPLNVFDQNRSPACLYQAGDRIRFIPITKKQFEKIAEDEAGPGKGQSAGGKGKSKSAAIPFRPQAENQNQKYVCTSSIKIIEPGLITSVQDMGRLGLQHQGIGQSGVMDAESFALGNTLLGNEDNAACLEATALGPTLKFILPCEFVITGGECSATLNEKTISLNQKYFAEAGSILKCGFITKGLRSYICFKGGLLVPQVFASRSTNLKSKSGGYFGRKLKVGDEIAVGDMVKKEKVAVVGGTEKKAIPILQQLPSSGSQPLVLKCTKGSQYSDFSAEVIKDFQGLVFTVLPESDRMGIRFSGQSLNCGKTDIISDAIPFGAVQITSAGLPVVMAADRQTTGGYAKIAAVTRHSMCLLAQAVPGTNVKFKIE